MIKRFIRLWFQLAKRELILRHRGSILGFAWPVLTPLLMLSIYTFFFTTLFDARFGGQASGGGAVFSTTIFAGLIVHGFFIEVLTKSPESVRSNPNLVKKIVFPTQILPLVTVSVSMTMTLFSISILLGAAALVGSPSLAVFVWLPIIWVPFLILTTGVAFVLASVGVFVRDLTHVTGLLGTALLFLSPIFFPVNALPDWVQPWILLNPLTVVVEEIRNTVIFGLPPNLDVLFLYWCCSLVIFFGGYFFFMRVRKEFADVL